MAIGTLSDKATTSIILLISTQTYILYLYISIDICFESSKWVVHRPVFIGVDFGMCPLHGHQSALNQVSQSPEVRRELHALRQLRGEELWVFTYHRLAVWSCSIIGGGDGWWVEYVGYVHIYIYNYILKETNKWVLVTYHHSVKAQKLNLRSYKWECLSIWDEVVGWILELELIRAPLTLNTVA